VKKKVFILTLALAATALLAMAWTGAWFSGTKTSTGETFTAGTLKLDGEGFTTFDLGDIVSNMAPGDLTKDATITIKNSGSLPLVWLGDWEITGGNKLRQAIYIDYAKMEFLKPDNTSWLDSDEFIKNGRGSGNWPTEYNNIADLNKFHVVGLDVWDGFTGMNTQPYQHVGILKPGYSYKLTVRFGFAKDAGNEYQGDVVDPVNIRLRVDATQANSEALKMLTSWSDWAWLNGLLALQH